MAWYLLFFFLFLVLKVLTYTTSSSRVLHRTPQEGPTNVTSGGGFSLGLGMYLVLKFSTNIFLNVSGYPYSSPYYWFYTRTTLITQSRLRIVCSVMPTSNTISRVKAKASIHR